MKRVPDPFDLAAARGAIRVVERLEAEAAAVAADDHKGRGRARRAVTRAVAIAEALIAEMIKQTARKAGEAGDAQGLRQKETPPCP